MLVYGDSQFTTSAQAFLKQFRGRIEHGDVQDADQLRALLIQAGQFEQGIWDVFDNGAPQRQEDLAAMELTNAAASALFCPAKVSMQLDRIRQSIDRLDGLRDLSLRIKIPEGYGFMRCFRRDVAGLVIEWGLPKARVENLLQVFVRQGVCIEDRLFELYQLGYAGWGSAASVRTWSVTARSMRACKAPTNATARPCLVF